MIKWEDLTGSDQIAVEYFLNHFRNCTKNDEDFISNIRYACWTIGEANEELIVSGFWNEEYGEPEPNEKNVTQYLINYEK